MDPKQKLLRNASQGGLAGLIATAPMTLVMVAIQKSLPCDEQYALPPRQITREIAQTAKVPGALRQPQEEPLVWAAHYSFGALMGALYGVKTGNQAGDSLARGMAYGFAVWAANYLALLPATNMRASATKEPRGRNVMMIASHLAWGASLEYCLSRFRRAYSRSAGSDFRRTRRIYRQHV